MPWFEYEGLTQGGTAIVGRVEAATGELAREDLARMGVDLRGLARASRPTERMAGLDEDDLIFFNEQLASLAQAGIALDEGLAQLARDLSSPRLKSWIGGLVEDLRRGETIDQAIAKREGGLPILYSRVIRAGVESGELPATLLNLNQHLRLTGDTKRMMWEVTSYPLMILALAMTISSMLLIFVIPRFKDIYKDFGTELPGMTQFLMDVADWFGHGRPPGWTIVWFTPIAIALIWHLLSYTRSGRVFRESVVLSIPIVGGVHRALLVARFLRSVATAVATDIPLPDAMRLSADATGSRLLSRDAEWLASEVERGHSIFVANQSTRVIPPLFGFCVQVATGREELPRAIGTLSHSYENRAVHTQSMLRVLLYPALIVFTGGLIGFVIVSLFLPLVRLINSVSSGGAMSRTMSSIKSISLFLLVLAIILAFCGLNAWFGLHNPGIASIGQAAAICCIAACVLYVVWHRRRRGSERPTSGSVMLPLLCILTVFLLLDAISILFGYREEVLISWIILVVIFLTLTVLYALYLLLTTWTRRRATHRIVIGQIATVVRQNLPLATGLKLAAESESGAARKHLLRMSKLLAQGASLAEATQIGFTDCPALPLSLIIAGEKSGQLAMALEQAEAAVVQRAAKRERVDVSVWPFLLVVLAFMVLVVTGIMVAVIPKFKEIFKDFGTPLPPLTLRMIALCEFMSDSGLLLILMILFLIGVVVGIYLYLRPRRVGSLRWTSRVADWVRWHVPGWRSIEFSTGMTAALRTMRMAVHSGLDLASSARLAATVDINNQLRPRISHFADLIEAGTNPRAAADRAGLGDVTGVALSSGQRNADLDAGLRYAADYNEALTNRFWILLRNLSWPIATILLGLLVGLVVVALFEPLIALIDAVANSYGK